MTTEKLGTKKTGVQILDPSSISGAPRKKVGGEQKPELLSEPNGDEQTEEHRRLVPEGGSSTHRKLFGGQAPGQLTMYELQMDMVRMRRGELPKSEGLCEQKKKEKEQEEREEDFDEHVGNVFVQGTHDRVARLHADQKAKADDYENYRWEEREYDDRLVFDQQSEDQIIEDQIVEDQIADEAHAEYVASERAAVDDQMDALALEQQLLEDRWAMEKQDDGLFDDDLDYELRREELLRSGDPNAEQELLEMDLERERSQEEAYRRQDDREQAEREQAADEWRHEEFYFHEHNDSLRRD